ncbi:internal scaffolding protein [Blackfly microvirus SF02]|uniref:Internal scaffolding protein n=1 Tax=Blackfly microvirus SF02 TaxID=2576452 RepID=A0A4P8PPQ3_9VIRU|nr:internal scaffolding protein [Blackfly microvirus SF02]
MNAKKTQAMGAALPGGSWDTPDPLTGEIIPPEPDIPVVFLRTPHNYDTMAASNETAVGPFEETLTQQQFRDEADINTIVARFGLTGELPENGAYPAYGDFETVQDYHGAQNIVRSAAEAFMALPGAVRERFANDPQKLMDFASKPENLPELRKLGLTRTLSDPAPSIDKTPKPQAGVPARDIPPEDRPGEKPNNAST